MKPVYINGRFLAQPLKGVQRFAIEITRGLIADQLPIRIVAPPNARNDLFAEHLVLTGRASGHLWEQSSLPMYLKKQHSPLLLNFGNTAPLAYRNQLVTIHDVAFIRYPAGYSPIFRAYYQTLIPRLLRRARQTITVSEFSKNEILDAYRGLTPDQIAVVYNAAGNDFQPPASDIEDRHATFLTFASDSDLKNYDLVLRAFAKLTQYTKAHLRVVGHSDRFKADEVPLANGSTITLLGRIDDETLRTEYQRSTAFVFPPHYAGFGIPPIEAQACGCPVISSNAASLPEVLQHSAIYFSPTNEAELATAMQRMLDEHELVKQLRFRGFENAKRFGWQQSANHLAHLVRRLEHRST